MMLKLDIRRKRTGYYPIEGGAISMYYANGYRSGEAVELYFQDRGFSDMIEPTVSVTLKPEEALFLSEQLRIAALAASGSHERGNT